MEVWELHYPLYVNQLSHRLVMDWKLRLKLVRLCIRMYQSAEVIVGRVTYRYIKVLQQTIHRAHIWSSVWLSVPASCYE